MEDENSTPPRERRQFQNYRSTASNNWRMKDDSPRIESPQQPRGDREQTAGRSYRGRGDDNEGYSPRPRNNNAFGDRPPREQREIPTEVTTPRLYVGNLLYTAQQSDIESFFLNNGFNVAGVNMSLDPMTGRNQSYCFVDLESVDEAKRAMEVLNGQEVMGRTVRINPGVGRKDQGQNPGTRDAVRNKSYEGGGARWREGAAGGPDGTDTPPGNRQSSDRWNKSTSTPNSSDVPAGKRLYIGNLPSMAPDQVTPAIQSLLSSPPLSLPIESILSVSKLLSPKAPEGVAPATGDNNFTFVDLSSSEEVDLAIEALNDSVSPFSENGEGTLRVNRAREGGARRAGVGDRERTSFGGGERGGREQQQRGGGGERSFGRNTWRGRGDFGGTEN